MSKSLDVIAVGSCYVDINLEDFPFEKNGIPPEIEIVGNSYETVPGGSAVNFCKLLQDLGLHTSFIGMVGNDANGDFLESLLKKNGVAPALIRKSDVSTNISFNMTNPQGTHIMLAAGTANAALDPQEVFPKLEQIISDTKMLYLGGCFKLKKFQHSFSHFSDHTQKNGTQLVIDHGRIPKDTTPEMISEVKALVQNAAYYFASRDEFCQLWEVDAIEDGLRLLNKKSPNVIVVVKDSDNGAYYLSEGSVQHIDAVKIDRVISVTGAGDSFNAGVMTAVTKGFDLYKAVQYGCNVAAAKISGKNISVLE